MSWFGLGKKEVSQASVDAALQKKQDEQKRDPYRTKEVRDFLTQVRISQDNLRLNAIRQNADTLMQYLQLLTQDFGLYASTKDEVVKDRQKQGIATKVKMMTQRSLELKNLLALLEPHYFEVIKDKMTVLFEMTKDKDIAGMMKTVDEEVSRMREVDLCLSKLVAYNDLLNGEKNPNFGEEIARAVQAREIHRDIDQLSKLIRDVVLDREKGIVGMIQQEKVLAALKLKIEG